MGRRTSNWFAKSGSSTLHGLALRSESRTQKTQQSTHATLYERCDNPPSETTPAAHHHEPQTQHLPRHQAHHDATPQAHRSVRRVGQGAAPARRRNCRISADETAEARPGLRRLRRQRWSNKSEVAPRGRCAGALERCGAASSCKSGLERGGRRSFKAPGQRGDWGVKGGLASLGRDAGF